MGSLFPLATLQMEETIPQPSQNLATLFEELLQDLPPETAQMAREFKDFTRSRKIKSPDQRLEKLPKAVQDISWKAPVRLCTRYRQLSARGKHANQVVVAIARELIACMWAITKEVSVLPSKAQIVLEQRSQACHRKGRGPSMV